MTIKDEMTAAERIHFAIKLSEAAVALQHGSYEVLGSVFVEKALELMDASRVEEEK